MKKRKIKIERSSLKKNPQLKIVSARLKKLEHVLAQFPNLDPENVWHTLILLEQKPIERLQRGLLRAQKFNFYR